MADNLRDHAFGEVYEASATSLIEEFYVPALNRAAFYDRAVGYFRSTVYHLVGLAMSEFALAGGRIRLICSPSLAAEDEDTVRKVRRTTEDQIAAGLERDIAECEQIPREHAAVQLLATLLRHDILDLRVTYRPDLPGIFHSKLGIFRDSQSDEVSFSGSANETYMAWAANEERFHVFCSWRSDYERRQIADDKSYFERLWGSKIPDLKTAPIPELAREVLDKHALRDPEEAVERVRLIHTEHPVVVGERRTGPRLQKHQAESRANWWDSQRGIISYVTGGGKTIAALAIADDWFARHDKGSVIVVVPSDILAKQWRQHLSSHEPQLSVLQVGGEGAHADWRTRLGDYTRAARVSQRRVVLAVVHSASRSDFLQRARVGEHTLLIADEVHRLGARQFRAVLTLAAGGRLGLSATPERFGDPEGTDAILAYFGPRLEPAFTILDAQTCKPPRLVPYSYHILVQSLTAAELREYQLQSQRIAQLIARQRQESTVTMSQQMRHALISRARVLKGASGKVALALRLLDEYFRQGERWLVYCDDTQQLEALRQQLLAKGLWPLMYHAAMSFSREATVDRFEKLGGILLSINCLDEGVDIPTVSHALILASSANPRQHLQRRGRVLRTSPGKVEATIFDVLCAPDESQPKVVFDQELQRAAEFGQDAANRAAVSRLLRTYSPYSDPDSPWTDFETDDDQ